MDWPIPELAQKNPEAILLEDFGAALVGLADLGENAIAIYDRRRMINVLLDRGMEPQVAVATVTLLSRRDGPNSPLVIDRCETLNEQLGLD